MSSCKNVLILETQIGYIKDPYHLFIDIIDTDDIHRLLDLIVLVIKKWWTNNYVLVINHLFIKIIMSSCKNVLILETQLGFIKDPCHLFIDIIDKMDAFLGGINILIQRNDKLELYSSHQPPFRQHYQHNGRDRILH